MSFILIKKSYLTSARKKTDRNEPFIESDDEFIVVINRDKLESIPTKNTFGYYCINKV